PDDVHHPDRVAPAPPWRLAGQDDQALRVPAHAGGQMVDAVQVLEFLGLARPALHAVEQGELAVQQRLAAPGQGPEHVAYAATELALADGRLHRGSLYRVERLPDPPDLIGARRELRCLRGHVHVLARAQPLHNAGQVPGRQVKGRPPELGELLQQTAADPQRHDDGEHHAHQAEASGQDEPEENRVGDRLRGGRQYVRYLVAPGVERSGDPRDGCVPGRERYRRYAARPRVVDHLVLERFEWCQDLRADDLLIGGPVAGVQLG